jgi:regulation of enolase protein 1 (concanavalin A-like superfamily)
MTMAFTLSAAPGTDLWRKPPTTDISNATATSIHATIPQTAFVRAKISFSAVWGHRYDQGGLVLRLSKAGQPDRWVKTGVEFYNDRAFISTVGCDRYADWSIYPTGDEDANGNWTIEVKRENDENGKSLWVYWLNGKERVPLREVAWFFGEEGDWDISVSAMAARPASMEVTGGSELEVKFWGIEIDTQ